MSAQRGTRKHLRVPAVCTRLSLRLLFLQTNAQTPFPQFARLFARASLVALRRRGGLKDLPDDIPEDGGGRGQDSVPPRSVSLLSYSVAKTLDCLTQAQVWSSGLEGPLNSQTPLEGGEALSEAEMLALLCGLTGAAAASVMRFALSEMSNAAVAVAAFSSYAQSLRGKIHSPLVERDRCAWGNGGL